MKHEQTPDGPAFFWFLPTHGDGRYLGSTQGGRVVDLAYLKQVAIAADSLGYGGVLIATGASCEESWLVAAALAPMTSRLKFLVAVRPGLQPASLAARMTATLDRLSDGRALINVVAGGDPAENRGDGFFLAPAEHYALTREFLRVYRRLLRGERVDFEGARVRVVGADRFILSGYPHLEAAHRFAELVMPLMPAASRPARLGARANTGPFGGAVSPATAKSRRTP